MQIRWAFRCEKPFSCCVVVRTPRPAEMVGSRQPQLGSNPMSPAFRLGNMQEGYILDSAVGSRLVIGQKRTGRIC